MALCPEHPKRDQNPKFTPLSETTSIPVCFIWDFPPPGGVVRFLGIARLIFLILCDFSRIILIVLQAATLLLLNIVFTYLSYKLYMEFGWKIYKRVRFNIKLRGKMQTLS